MLLEEMRKAVLTTAVKMDGMGLTRSTSGNVSAFDRESNLVAITPSGLPYDVLTPADITVVNLEGQVVDGKRKPSSETPMHTAIYRASVELLGPRCSAGLPSIGAIVHTHSPFATAFAVMNRGLPPITVPLALLGGTIPIIPFEIPGSNELASVAASALVGREGDNQKCVLLQNHGLVCTGPDLHAALEAAVYVEEGAEVAIHVLSAGGELMPIPQGIVENMRKRGSR